MQSGSLLQSWYYCGGMCSRVFVRCWRFLLAAWSAWNWMWSRKVLPNGNRYWHLVSVWNLEHCLRCQTSNRLCWLPTWLSVRIRQSKRNWVPRWSLLSSKGRRLSLQRRDIWLSSRYFQPVEQDYLRIWMPRLFGWLLLQLNCYDKCDNSALPIWSFLPE